MHRRRYLTIQAEGTEDAGKIAAASALRSVRGEVPGTPIPADFPHREALLAAKYEALEDLEDVTPEQLASRGIKGKQAKDVVAALARLATPATTGE